ncbi:serine hydrolase [Sphingomonas sp. SFZ2018-12]|uniref:serine hydrolase domain-containing protein n=1 Tax=Sphingomonas sp. SFZ2018-12 TaxID=2683197 RepID=UPI001F0F7D3D
MRRAISLGLMLAAVPAAAQQVSTPPTSSAHHRAIAAGYKALALCEGVIAAGRSEAAVAALELTGIYPEYEAMVAKLPARIDRPARRVSVVFDLALKPRVAAWSPRFGCMLAPIGGERIPLAGEPGNEPLPAPADPRPWPMGDRGIAPKPSDALAVRVTAAMTAFYRGRTTGIVIVRDGRIIAESYAEGFGPFTANRTWSVAKSIAGTVAGLAVADRLVDPRAPALVPEWRTPGDPRAAITLENLLRMSSGLHSDTAGNRTDAIYFGGTTVTEQATGWPLIAPPGTRFRYANNDILLAMRAIRAAMADDARYHAYPATRLFAPLGMRHTTAGADWQGNFVLSSQVYTTARDLARLGQFWLQDGVWQGRRLLPAGWMRTMTTPVGQQPAGNGPRYGATMWLFGPQQGLPAGTFSAQGNRGQFVMVVPQHRLVIVRRGEDPVGNGFEVERFAADVIAALK